MTVEYVTKEKIESLVAIMPQVVTKVLLAPEEARYVLLTEEKLLSSYFIVAIIVDSQISWISDENYRQDVELFIAE